MRIIYYFINMKFNYENLENLFVKFLSFCNFLFIEMEIVYDCEISKMWRK